MNERAALWLAAAEVIEAGRHAAFATVARKRGSLPMASDAKMLITTDGKRWGTVGGGCLEADVTTQALAAVESGQPALVRHTLNADLIGDLALSCGGTVELFLEPLPPSAELAALCRAVGLGIDRRQPATVVTALEWSDGPRKTAEVGDERWSLGPAPSAARPRSPSLVLARPTARHTAAFVDEESGVFVEPIPRSPRVTIFGAGHVGAAIGELAAQSGFHVVVVDDRAEFANRERLPSVQEIVVEDFRSVLDRMSFDQGDYVLATTRGHSFDAYIVERTAASTAAYVGMLGSRRKREVIWRALEAAGLDRAALDRVKAPIGDEIGADTPAEIAVSVVAELIRLRRFGR